MDQKFNECSVSAVSRCSVWVCHVISAMMLFFAVVGAAEQGGPVRVEVVSKQLEVAEGSDTQITVQLVDAGGTRVPAGKTVQVQVEIARGDTIFRTVPVMFRPGESAREVTIPASETGVLSVEATSEELLKGATMLRVKPPSGRILMMGISADAANDSPAPRAASPLSRRSDERSEIVRAPEEREEADAPANRSLALTGELPAAGHRLVNEHATGPDGEDHVLPGLPLSLKLWGSPDRSLRADGADRAKIYAFLHGEPDHPGIRLTLLNSLGRLAPRELHIPTGQTSGEASLTSDRPGNVTVDLVGTFPALDIVGQRNLEFDFHPPIDGLVIVAPTKLEIGDVADLAVDLVNVSGTPVRSMEPRTLEFRVVVQQRCGRLAGYRSIRHRRAPARPRSIFGVEDNIRECCAEHCAKHKRSERFDLQTTERRV